MIDLGKTIEPKSDQANADDFLAGPRTVTITRVSATEASDQPISINFAGDDNRPFKPCKSMRRVLVNAWGRDGTQYVGKSMTLFCDKTVKWAGAEVGGIRISHMSHIAKPLVMALTATRGNRKPYVVKPLVVDIDPEAASEEAIQNTARLNAEQGKVSLENWWKSISKPDRAVAMEIMDELKALTEKADNKEYNTDASDDDVPDYLPEDD